MSDVPDYTIQPQPQPIPRDTPGMHDLAIADMTQCWADTPSLMGTPEEKAIIGIIEDLEKRKDFGFKKYGTLLQANNGRDPVQDALEEALDLIVYIKQITEEVSLNKWNTVQFDSMYRNAIEFAIALKFFKMNRENQDDNGRPSEVGSSDLER